MLAYAELQDKDDKVFDYYPMEVWGMLQEVVPGLCMYWRTILDPEKNDGESVGARWIDIYVWAVLLGNTDLATMLLPACQEPIRAAVIGARLYDYMSYRMPLNAVELI